MRHVVGRHGTTLRRLLLSVSTIAHPTESLKQKGKTSAVLLEKARTRHVVEDDLAHCSGEFYCPSIQ